jgi:hypothetical protein
MAAGKDENWRGSVGIDKDFDDALFAVFQKFCSFPSIFNLKFNFQS